MSKTYAKINLNESPGIIVNVEILDDSDIQDPAFTWTDITKYSPMPSIGWTTTDGINFTNPAPSTTLNQAIQLNLIEFQSAIQTFVDNSYSLEIRFNFMALYTLAVQNNLLNRAAYISQLFTWAQSVVSYCAQYTSSVQALTSVQTVQSTTWDLTQISANPMVTTIVAILIMN